MPGNRILTWSSDGTIIIRKYESGQLSATPETWFKAGKSSRPAFSMDGSRMVTGNTGTWARIWKPADHSVEQELFGHHGEVTDFAFASGDQTLFTTGRDHTIRVWKTHIEKEKKDTTRRNNPPVPVRDSLPAKPVTEGREMLNGRTVEKTSEVEVSDSTIDIYVFDNSTPDGDVMSLYFHNQWIISHYEVTKKKMKVTLHLNTGSDNYLVMFADNLGRTPPNTAAISFEQNKHERIFRLSSDMKSCSAIHFIYLPNQRRFSK